MGLGHSHAKDEAADSLLANHNMLLSLHNKRKFDALDDSERLKFSILNELAGLNMRMLEIRNLPESTTVEDVAGHLGKKGVNYITIHDQVHHSEEWEGKGKNGEKSDHFVTKTAYVGFDTEADCAKVFLDSENLTIKGRKVYVMYGDVNVIITEHLASQQAHQAVDHQVYVQQ